ncbi:MAG: deoxyribodipyrimidine photo-lyase [Pseudomonadota bacterium]
MTNAPVIIWFRRDLRVEDNPALAAAHETKQPVIPLFILEPESDSAPGAASRWWLHHALAALETRLADRGSKLILRTGPASDILPNLVKETGASQVFWNRRYGARDIETDKALKTTLTDDGVSVESFNGTLVCEPWETKTGSGGFYKVYTPFWKSIKAKGPSRKEQATRPDKLAVPDTWPDSTALAALDLLPTKPDWAAKFPDWEPGEKGARAKLRAFLDGPVNGYDDDRNRPDIEGTSRLSPHLAWGEISPLQIWETTKDAVARGSVNDDEADKFLSEVVWRDFAYNLLYYYPDIRDEPIKPEFADFPWDDDRDALTAWQKGQTGYPIVDAGMRQLYDTGWMHNRVRMITASFLIKDLIIPWQEGERWFWDCLVDADLANNAASWQWVAGCGADAAPYFRIFNPVSQGEKFDPQGDYVRTYVPELAALPKKHIHKPWEAPDAILQEAGVTLGETYPKPIVDHGEARKLALAGYDQIRNK